MQSIRDVAPGGHHLGTPHTMKHFRTGFYRAELFDYDSDEAWKLNGAKDAYQRANENYKQQLAEYEAPELDPALDEELQAFIAQRKEQLSQ